MVPSIKRKKPIATRTIRKIANSYLLDTNNINEFKFYYIIFNRFLRVTPYKAFYKFLNTNAVHFDIIIIDLA